MSRRATRRTCCRAIPKRWHYPVERQSAAQLHAAEPRERRSSSASSTRATTASRARACGACHIEIIEAAERSLMATARDVLGRRRLQQRHPAVQELRRSARLTRATASRRTISSPPATAGHVTARRARARRARRALSAADLAGRPAGRRLPRVRARRPQHRHPVPRDRPAQLDRQRSSGSRSRAGPTCSQSNRGPGTGLRVAIPVLNIHKTRLNDPYMWFMGTNDQPGDYRHSGCAGLPRRLCQRPRAAAQPDLCAVRPRRADAPASIRPSRTATSRGHPHPPRLHPRDPDRAVHDLPHAPAEHLPEHLSRLHDVGLRVRRAGRCGRKQQKYPTARRESARRSSTAIPKAPRRAATGPTSTSCATSTTLNPQAEGHPVRRLSRPRLELPRRLQARPRGQSARRRRPRSSPPTIRRNCARAKAVRASLASIPAGRPHDGHPRREGHAVRRLPFRAGQPRQRPHLRRGRQRDRDRLHGLPRHRRRLSDAAHLRPGRAAAAATTCRCCATRTAAPLRMDRARRPQAADPALDRRSRARMARSAWSRTRVDPGQPALQRQGRARQADVARRRRGRQVRLGARRRRRTSARTSDDKMACYTCHLSWTTSCGGCHLPIEANWKTEQPPLRGRARRATSRPTTRRSRATTCSSSAGTGRSRATSIAPVRSTLGAGAVVDQHQPRADLRPAAADLGERLLEPGLRAALPAHRAHDRDQDLHRLPPVGERTTTTRSWRSCCCSGTNFVNFVGMQRLGRRWRAASRRCGSPNGTSRRR